MASNSIARPSSLEDDLSNALRFCKVGNDDNDCVWWPCLAFRNHGEMQRVYGSQCLKGKEKGKLALEFGQLLGRVGIARANEMEVVCMLGRHKFPGGMLSQYEPLPELVDFFSNMGAMYDKYIEDQEWHSSLDQALGILSMLQGEQDENAAALVPVVQGRREERALVLPGVSNDFSAATTTSDEAPRESSGVQAEARPITGASQSGKKAREEAQDREATKKTKHGRTKKANASQDASSHPARGAHSEDFKRATRSSKTTGSHKRASSADTARTTRSSKTRKDEAASKPVGGSKRAPSAEPKRNGSKVQGKAQAEKAEPARGRSKDSKKSTNSKDVPTLKGKKPGPKPKKTTKDVDDTTKDAPPRKGKKPGPKPKKSAPQVATKDVDGSTKDAPSRKGKNPGPKPKKSTSQQEVTKDVDDTKRGAKRKHKDMEEESRSSPRFENAKKTKATEKVMFDTPSNRKQAATESTHSKQAANKTKNNDVSPQSLGSNASTVVDYSLPNFREDILPILFKKLDFKFKRQKYYCLPGVDPRSNDAELGTDYFDSPLAMQKYFCAYGLGKVISNKSNSNWKTLLDKDQTNALKDWIRYAIVPCLRAHSCVPEEGRVQLEFKDAWRQLQKIGFRYVYGKYVLPGVKLKRGKDSSELSSLGVMGVNMFESIEALQIHLARFGLPANSHFSAITPTERLQVELYLASCDEVDIFSKWDRKETDPPLNKPSTGERHGRLAATNEGASNAPGASASAASLTTTGNEETPKAKPGSREDSCSKSVHSQDTAVLAIEQVPTSSHASVSGESYAATLVTRDTCDEKSESSPPIFPANSSSEVAAGQSHMSVTGDSVAETFVTHVTSDEKSQSLPVAMQKSETEKEVAPTPNKEVNAGAKEATIDSSTVESEAPACPDMDFSNNGVTGLDIAAFSECNAQQSLAIIPFTQPTGKDNEADTDESDDDHDADGFDAATIEDENYSQASDSNEFDKDSWKGMNTQPQPGSDTDDSSTQEHINKSMSSPSVMMEERDGSPDSARMALHFAGLSQSPPGEEGEAMGAEEKIAEPSEPESSEPRSSLPIEEFSPSPEDKAKPEEAPRLDNSTSSNEQLPTSEPTVKTSNDMTHKDGKIQSSDTVQEGQIPHEAVVDRILAVKQQQERFPIGQEDPWKDVQKQMKNAGWVHRQGGLGGWWWLLPGGKPQHLGGEEGEDYVQDEFSMMKFATEHLGWAGDKKYREELHDREIEASGSRHRKARSPSSLSASSPTSKEPSASAKKLQKSFPNLDSLSTGASRIQKSAGDKGYCTPELPSDLVLAAKRKQKEKTPVRKDDHWINVKEKMRYVGWKYKPSSKDSWYYLLPNGKPKNSGGKEGKDFVEGEWGMMHFAVQHLGWKGDEHYREELKFREQAANGSRPRRASRKLLTTTSTSKSTTFEKPKATPKRKNVAGPEGPKAGGSKRLRADLKSPPEAPRPMAANAVRAETSHLTSPERKGTVKQKLIACTNVLNRTSSDLAVLAGISDIQQGDALESSTFNSRVDEIQTFLENVIESRGATVASSLYICGRPGTGKTSAVSWCCKNQEQKAMEKLSPLGKGGIREKPIFCFINGAHIQANGDEHRLLMKELAKSLGLKLASPTASNVENHLDLTGRKSRLLVVVIDEIDLLISERSGSHETQSEKSLRKILSWASSENHSCALIGISNLVGNQKSKRLHNLGTISRTITFPVYSKEVLIGIIEQRIGRSIVDPQAVAFVASKISVTSGDARKALELTSSAVSRCLESLSDEQKYSSQLDSPVVKMRHMMQAIRASLPSIGDIIENLPQMAKVILCVALALSQVGSAWKVFSLGSLKEYCMRATEHGMFDDDQLSMENFWVLVQQLIDSGIILTGNTGVTDELSNHCYGELYNLPISLGVQLEDVESVMNETLGQQAFYRDMIDYIKRTDRDNRKG